jgi:predicted transcriptional regulator
VRKQPKTSKPRKASNTVRHEAVKLLSRAGGVTLPELMKAFKWQAHSVRGFISILQSKHGFKIESSKVDGVRTYRIK